MTIAQFFIGILDRVGLAVARTWDRSFLDFVIADIGILAVTLIVVGFVALMVFSAILVALVGEE